MSENTVFKTVGELVVYLQTLDQSKPIMIIDDYWMGAGFLGKVKEEDNIPYSQHYSSDGKIAAISGYYWE